MTDQKKETRKFLFISHHASRSGAPYVLLYLLQWLRKHTPYRFDLFLIENGPLYDDFAKIADRVFLLPDMLHEDHNLGHRIKRKLKLPVHRLTELEKVTRFISPADYSLVYGNTIVSLPWLISFKKNSGVKTVCAIHELSYVLEVFHSAESLRTELPTLDLIIAGSKAVAGNLNSRYGVPAEMIRVVPSFIHTYQLPLRKGPFLAEKGAPANRFVIGGAGMAEWRKGSDLLVPLAMMLKKKYPQFDFQLVWIGTKEKDDFTVRLRFDIEKAGVGDRITLIDTTPHYLEYIDQFQVFAMLSREDPFPLVSLEAAYLEKPLLMFKGTGGTAELLENGGGVEVGYLDLEAMADALWKLYADPALRKEMGRILKEEVLRNYSSDVACRKALEVLEQVIQMPAAS